MTEYRQAALLLALAKYCTKMREEINKVRNQAAQETIEYYRNSALIKALHMERCMNGVRWITLRFRDDLYQIFDTTILDDIAVVPFHDLDEMLEDEEPVDISAIERVPIGRLGCIKKDKLQPDVSNLPAAPL